MAVTMKDIAKLAGVHESTVSMVLNNYSMISPATKARVLGIMKQLDYHPNASAQRLSKRRSFTIGVYVQIKNMHLGLSESSGEILSGVGAAASGEFDYDVLMQAPQVGASENDYMRLFDRQKIDGAVILMPVEDDPGVKTLEKKGVPVVLVCDRSDVLDYVQIDNAGAVRKTLEYLAALGHRKIGAFSGTDNKLDHKERLDTYMAFMEEQGLPPIIAAGTATDAGGIEAMKKMLADKPTAVICGNDGMAIGAMRVIRDSGLRVPEDISVVGFDDVAVASTASPRLTTIKQPYFEMGKESARMLIARIEKKAQGQQKKIFPAELIIRESTAKPPRKS